MVWIGWVDGGGCNREPLARDIDSTRNPRALGGVAETVNKLCARTLPESGIIEDLEPGGEIPLDPSEVASEVPYPQLKVAQVCKGGGAALAKSILELLVGQSSSGGERA